MSVRSLYRVTPFRRTVLCYVYKKEKHPSCMPMSGEVQGASHVSVPPKII
jgi:ribosomal protein L34E